MSRRSLRDRVVGRARSLPRNTSVLAFSGSLAALAVTGYTLLLRHGHALHASFAISWIVLALAFAASDNFAIHVEFGDNAHSFNLNELPLVIGLFTCDPRLLVVARVLGALLALTVLQRQRFVKLAFNLSLAALETVTVVGIFEFLARGTDRFEGGAWAVAIVAASLVVILQALAVTTAIRLSGGRPERRDAIITAAFGILSAAATASLGIATVIMLEADAVAGAAVMTVISAVLFLAYRGYAVVTQRYANLEKLYGFTKLLTRSPEFETAITVTLREACQLLRADKGELSLLDQEAPGGGYVRVVYTAGDVDISVGENFAGVLARANVIEHRRGLVLPRHTRDANERRCLSELGVIDAAIVPILNADDVVGTLAVYNRRGDISTFDNDDLKVFETLANHASVSLDNARLIDRLRDELAQKQHQAFHDPLTELGNRNLLTVRAEEALVVRRASGSQLAVLMMDLNHFKEVNDTLGHQQGDALLREVALRLRRHAPADATITRLGGDEFAILLPRVRDAQEAIDTALTLYSATQEPFVVSDLQLAVTSAIGVAVAPDHGDQISVLLQHADIAMYTAKEARDCGVALYDDERNHHSERRLTLAGELRAAIETNALEVYYQPKAEFTTGEVVGVEALLRWEHPTYGHVPPEEFVALAEGTGLMRELTTFVLRRALRQLAEWHRAGLNDLHVSVNLSARSLISVELVHDIDQALRETNVSPGALTLEITETQMMADRVTTVDVLERLNAIGVRISIDDFGTGYSSLSYLHSLPVDELKIDKSFVLEMRLADANVKIVQSIIDLGRNLGLVVVAEGIEDARAWEALLALGCNVGQGYYLSRPVPPERLTPWLLQRKHAAADASTQLSPSQPARDPLQPALLVRGQTSG